MTGLRGWRPHWILLAGLLLLPAGAQAETRLPGAIGDQAGISVAELPVQARDTLRAIRRGGPFAYPRDGALFKNYEHALPEHRRGYYREYTVKTPGRHDRGARRIIRGAGGEYFYTDDHYRTFRRIRE